ncbi:MAG: hypothetical protein GY866_02380, partial [Proteobacteria bacterium]|nr:hypothetical protein [Pseudomonadota bacterium]
IKVLGNLNEFIRANMLEEQGVERECMKLRANYDNQLFSHKAIEKAKAQVDLLEPVITGGEKFEKISAEVEKLESAKKGVSPCFAKEKITLLESAIEDNDEKLKGVTEHIENIGNELSDLNREQEELVVAISTDKVSEQIRRIEREIEDLSREKDVRKGNAEKYNRVAERLNLPRDPDEELFRQSAAQVNERKRRYEERLEALVKEWSNFMAEMDTSRKEFDDALVELESLRKRKNNIPMRHLAIRRRIADHLDIRENEIPFVGELVRVKETELAWEGAVEILLRDLGLSLLVPEKYCNRVNQFVEEADLKDRLTYHKVPETISFDVFDSIARGSLISKLEINSDAAFSLFYDWIARHVKKRYDYICVEDLKDFERLDRALMPNGMVKDLKKFEKDDRPLVREKSNYIFGWDNKEKIMFFE